MENLSFFQKIKPYLKNKYVLICLFFVVFASGSVYNRCSNSREISRLEDEIKHYQQKTNEIEKSIEELRSNKKSLEKLAREKYGMKQDDEDVFVGK